MATIKSTSNATVCRIREFLGLNQNQDGDTKLRLGELSEMRNFKITPDRHLQIRPGSKTIINLRTAWNEWGKTHTASTNSPAFSGAWEGMVGGAHHILAAFGGVIWDVSLSAETAVAVGQITQASTSFFGFSQKVYCLNGHEYKAWDGNAGTTFQDVEGYIPVIYTAMQPNGSGTELEGVNRLTGKRRVKYSPDGDATTFQLPETEISEVIGVTGTSATYTSNLAAGTITFASAPAKGINTVEVTYRKGNGSRSEVTGMRFSELFNGSTDTRVFLYGDGSNKTIYTGLDYNGLPSAEYFPDLYEAAIGEANTPITGMIRHYSRMMVFKTNSAWSLQYGTITLDNSLVTSAFYVTPVNRQFGNDAPGQARLLENNPLTLDIGGIYQWQATSSSGAINSSETNAKRVSDRVQQELDSYDLKEVRTFNSKQEHEFWFLYADKALILNYATDSWYIYTDISFKQMLEVEGDVYGFRDNGEIAEMSRAYRNDDNRPINAYAATGSMDFDRDWVKKYSPFLFIAMKPESNARINVTVESNRRGDYPDKLIAYSLATYNHADFNHWAFGTNRKPQTRRVKMKVKKATFYKLIFSSNSITATATILEADIQLRFTGNVK